MVNSAAGTAPKTSPHGINSTSGLNSTPLVVGSAAVSEHISTLGVRVHNVCPWITHDVDNYRKCDADAMLQELLCGFEERPSSEKSKLLQDSLKAVLEICHNTPEITDNLTELTSTGKIRKSLGIQDPDGERGSRVLYIIVFRKLVPITSLSGDEFLSAWWQVVLCHHTLWKHNVQHRDISPSNIMVYWLNGQWIGVLNDYDLSSIECDGPSGKERTGTVPFMAIDLLTKNAIPGKVTHLYRHDAESLVWVLIWVCLRYQGGKLMSNGRLLDDWLKVDAKGCKKKKSDFIWKFRHGEADLKNPSPSHQSNWKIAVACLHTMIHAPRAKIGENEFILQTWLLNNVESVVPDIVVRHPVNVS
ncbi:hypothetical protein BDR04DRAFT_1105526 [Suillus decipiens]|nr:hypothetical protein BDR04DRAFT_1105526 [Suillus decipiens]